VNRRAEHYGAARLINEKWVVGQFRVRTGILEAAASHQQYRSGQYHCVICCFSHQLFPSNALVTLWSSNIAPIRCNNTITIFRKREKTPTFFDQLALLPIT
jgi:hypothetical protein